MKKKLLAITLSIISIFTLAACETEAEVVSENLSKSADSFKVQRRIVFLNAITDNYLFTVEGLCAINTDSEKKLTVTCKTGKNSYKKHYLGLSDNVTYFGEQTDAKYEDPYHYKILFRPEQIIPNVEIQTSK